MKKNITAKKNQRALPKTKGKQIREVAARQRLTVGLDLGDRNSRYCILDEAGEVVSEGQVATTTVGFQSLLAQMPTSRVALEVGTHSPWVSRQIGRWGHEVLVANPHKVRLITHSGRKTDRIDAEKLARLARADPKLLAPIRHRGEEAQADLAVIRARAALVEARTALINSARGFAKTMGERMAKCDADQVGAQLGKTLRETIQNVVEPMLTVVEGMSAGIKVYDEKIEQMAERYGEVQLLKQIYGVGTLIGLTYILTLEDAERFQRSREVGPFLGLTRRQRDSGDSEPELGISKAGDRLLRSYLVQAAHCILRKGAPDSDLRRWGLSKMGQGGKKKAKRRAVVAVARKLGVLLHRLWVTGEVYDPNYNRKAAESARVVA